MKLQCVWRSTGGKQLILTWQASSHLPWRWVQVPRKGKELLLSLMFLVHFRVSLCQFRESGACILVICQYASLRGYIIHHLYYSRKQPTVIMLVAQLVWGISITSLCKFLCTKWKIKQFCQLFSFQFLCFMLKTASRKQSRIFSKGMLHLKLRSVFHVHLVLIWEQFWLIGFSGRF